jgi:hypothetical protein
MLKVRSHIGKGLWVLLGGVLIGVALIAFRGVLLYPHIEVENLYDGATVPKGVLHIRGTVTRTRELYINTQRIDTNVQGEFTHSVVVFAPSSQLVLRAVDKFGKEHLEAMTLVVQ